MVDFPVDDSVERDSVLSISARAEDVVGMFLQQIIRYVYSMPSDQGRIE